MSDDPFGGVLDDLDDDEEEQFPEDVAEEIGDRLGELFWNVGSEAAGWRDDIVSDPEGVADQLWGIADELIAAAREIRSTWRAMPRQRGVR